MRKNVFGRRFKRNSKERKALFKGLLTSLVIHEGIKTTEQKAKAIKGDADRMITHAKKDGLHAKRMLERYIHPDAIEKVIEVLAPRFTERQGGYTRITRIGRRFNDNATIVLIEWVERSGSIEKRSLKIEKSKENGNKKKIENETVVENTKKVSKIVKVSKAKKEKKK